MSFRTLLEGGNLSVKLGDTTYEAQKIPIKEIGIEKFRKDFVNLFKVINKLYFKKFKEYLWGDEKDLENGLLFNGSTSFIMDPKYSAQEIAKYKETSGDLDVIIPEEKAQNLWLLLKDLEDKKITSDIIYISNNRNNINALGDQINALFKYSFKKDNVIHTIFAQVDFEKLEFKNSKPSSFAKFSHSSSFEDLKLKVNIDNKEYSIKGGVNHKYLLRALVGAASEDPNILVVSDNSTYNKYKPVKYDDVPRTKTFSVLHGIGTAFTPVLDDKGNQAYSEDGKKLMKKNKTSDKNYIDDVDDMFDAIFGIGDRKDFASFGGVIKLLKLMPREMQEKTKERYFEILFGKSSQIIEKDDPQGDFNVKYPAFIYFLNELKLKMPNMDKKIETYYKTRFK